MPVTLDEFLRLRDADLGAVVSQVRSTLGFSEHDTLFAVGSLVEGLGTPKSDVDLILVTPRDDSVTLSRRVTALVVGRCLIDMRILPWSELEGVLTRCSAWLERPWNVTYAVKFSMEERTLLHRLLDGRVLHGDRGTRPLLRLPKPRELSRLKMHIARQNARTIQVDLAGYRQEGDYRSMVYAAQELLGQAIDALLAGHLITNPLVKWRSRLLDRLPDAWEETLGLTTNGASASAHIWGLHRAPEDPRPDAALLHALAISAFARAAFAWAERELVDGLFLERLPMGASPAASCPEGPPLPWLDFDVDFAFGADAVRLARLNEFDEPVTLTPDEFAAALLFDGRNSAAQAARALCSEQAPGAQVIERLRTRLAEAGLLFEHPDRPHRNS